ncbi:MAG: NAD(P)/FAD-dependent oxidoreductase [Methanobacteriota archaeon]
MIGYRIMSITCDVLVVGGGPAGLTSAIILGKKGFSTIVIEKNKRFGRQHSSYDITEGSRIRFILDEMKIKPSKISSVSEWFSPNHSHVLDSRIQDYYFKRGPMQDSLEQMLGKKIKNTHTKVFFESQIHSVKLEKKEITSVSVHTPHKNIVIQPQYIIGADGPESGLRKKLNIETKVFATFKGCGILVETKKNDTFPHAKIFFDREHAPGGYVYCGSVGRESFFCVVTDEKISKNIMLRKNLDLFLKKKIDLDFKTKNYFFGKGVSGIFKLKNSNVLLVGGAGLFYDPFLGYGLNYAIESGYNAAQAILKNDIRMYSNYVKDIQQEIIGMSQIRKIWRTADNRLFDKLIQTFNGRIDTKDKQINIIQKLFSEE